MANTYTKLYYQTIFAVKGRSSLINSSITEELYAYIASIIKHKKQFPIIINGMPDHLHLVFAMKPNISLSDLMRDVKANTSTYIKKKTHINFEWQRGFGAFSYGQSQLPTLINYVQNQQQHHQKMTFREEYIGFLKAFEIEYEEQYLFDFL